jgi:hypothetical protein
VYFPKPLGYYSITLPQSIVNEIEALTVTDAILMLAALTGSLLSSFEFATGVLSIDTCKWIAFGTIDDRLALSQWLLNGIRHTRIITSKQYHR